MDYLKPIIFSVLILLIAGCSKSWDEKHLDVDGADSYHAELVLERTINGVIFFLDIGVKFDEPNEPFCVRLGALSELGKEKLITVLNVEVSSSEESEYELITKNNLPLQLRLKPWEGYKKSICHYEFDGRLNPDFERNEQVTIKMKLEVEGETKELIFELTPVIRTFNENDLIPE
jgi:hypothetical protein